MTVNNALRQWDVHEDWQRRYRTADNERYFAEVLSRIVEIVQPAPGATFLDAGCGTGDKSIALAKLGYRVTGIDISNDVLREAKSRIMKEALTNRVKVRSGDISSIPCDDGQYDHILCWGVLMHNQDVESVVCELARVVKPQGTVIVSEANMHSLQSAVFRALASRTAAKIPHAYSDLGYEYWKKKAGGDVLIRHTDFVSLIKLFGKYDLELKRRLPGQLTEYYSQVNSVAVGRMIHGLNQAWFRHVKWSSPCYSNILLFTKKGRTTVSD